MTTSQPESVSWCMTCCTRHGIDDECPGELTATGAEQHGWRINADTPNGIEAYGVLIARSHKVWRARILTFPNVLWLAPGTRATMKFVGKTPQEAERQAADFIQAHCAERGYQLRDEPALVEPGQIDAEKGPDARGKGRDAAPRKVRFLPVRFGVDRANERGLTSSLSESGLSIITDAPVESGTHLSLSLSLDAKSLDLAGSVVWMRKHPEFGRAPGMGIRLEAPPQAYLDYVRALT